MKKHRRGLRLAACLLALAMCAALLCSCGRTGKTDELYGCNAGHCGGQ